MNLHRVKSFNLSIEEVVKKYRLMPSQDIYYHYTSEDKLESIINSGGLYATYRGLMNDAEELSFPKRVILSELSSIQSRKDINDTCKGIAKTIEDNNKVIFSGSQNQINSYCACLTKVGDDRNQWQQYGNSGFGCAIGFNLLNMLSNEKNKVISGNPYIFALPVCYDEEKQRDLVWELIDAGFKDIIRYSREYEPEDDEIRELFVRVNKEIILHIYMLITIFKQEKFHSEKEIRIMIDLNDGGINMSTNQYYEKNGNRIPYYMIDLCNETSKIMPIAEVVIGNKIFNDGKVSEIETMLDKHGYNKHMLHIKKSETIFD
jgi:Protein of unknown function (DUF2971)